MQDPLNPTADYTVPKGESRYLKFEEEQTEFMPVAGAIIGWEYWDTKNKPVRLSEKPDCQPSELPNIRADRDGSFKIKHFWAFPVIDCVDGKLKILEVTQKGIQKAIRGYAKNPRWGSPVFKYTITVGKEGQNLDTEYTVMANPLGEVPQEWVKAWEEAKAKGFNLDALFRGEDPFNPATKSVRSEADKQYDGDESVLPEYPTDNAVPPDEEEVIVA